MLHDDWINHLHGDRKGSRFRKEKQQQKMLKISLVVGKNNAALRDLMLKMKDMMLTTNVQY